MSKYRIPLLARVALATAVMTGFLVSDASAGMLRSAPVQLGAAPMANMGECAITNTSNSARSVEIVGRCADGSETVFAAQDVAPQGFRTVGVSCPEQAFTCEFRTEGPARSFRAQACNFILSAGCGTAVRAR